MIKQAFTVKKSLFIPFIMAGHPDLATSLEAMIVLADAGADIIELGVPFSDPVADGPVNQRAAEIALQHETTLANIFSRVQVFRQRGYTVPIVLFTYLNPLLAMGITAFATMALQAGVDGVLIVDLPPEEGQDIYAEFKRAGLGVVFLASPTTDPLRFALYRELEPVFIYYISRLAVTGMQTALADNLEGEIAALRTSFPTTKIVAGFGISTAEQVAQVAQFADGVVVGSLLVDTLEHHGLSVFKELVMQLVQGI